MGDVISGDEFIARMREGGIEFFELEFGGGRGDRGGEGTLVAD